MMVTRIAGIFVMIVVLLSNGAGSSPWACRYLWDRNDITEMAVKGNALWASTNVGVVRWNLTDASFTHYTMANGLPANGVTHIAIDSSGRVWCGALDGAYVLDGTTWKKVIPVTTPDYITKIVAKRDDTVCIASRNEVTLYAQDIAACYDSVDTTPLTDNVYTAGFDGKKRLWISVGGKFCAVRDSGAWKKVFSSSPGKMYYTVIQPSYDGKRTLLIGSESLEIFSDDTIITHPFKTYTTGINSVEQLADGRYLFAYEYLGPLLVDSSTTITPSKVDSSYIVKNTLGSVLRRSRLARQGDTLYLSYPEGGIYQYIGNQRKLFTTGDGLSHNWIICVKNDTKGRLWFGCGDYLIHQFNGIGYTLMGGRFTAGNHYRNHSMWCDRGGNLWVCSTFNLVRYSDTGATTYVIDQTQAEQVIVDKKGDVWVLQSDGEGISKLSGYLVEKFKPVNMPSGQEWGRDIDMDLDKNGDLIVKKDKQIFRIVNDTATIIGVDSFSISCIACDSTGTLWSYTGDRGRLCRYDDQGRATVFVNTIDSAETNQYLPTCMEIEPGGRIWIGLLTSDNEAGLLIYDKGIWKHLTTKDGLSDNNIYSIEIDPPSGNVYVSTDAGITVFENAVGVKRRFMTSHQPYSNFQKTGDAALFDLRGRLIASSPTGGLGNRNLSRAQGAYIIKQAKKSNSRVFLKK
jgi:streptogramin lyase